MRVRTTTRRIGWPSGLIVGLVLLLAGAAAAAAVKAGEYSGSTSESLPLTFQVSSNRTEVLNFRPTFSGSCTKSGSPATTSPQITSDVGRDIAIKHGGFRAVGLNGKLQGGSTVYGKGTDSVTGSFSGKTAKGTYSAQFTFNKSAPDGLAGYHCKTGTLTWTVKRV
jgi:hypothetical protein